jgi:hypothetical protein
MRVFGCVILFLALAGCASTSTSDNDKSIEVHGLFMGTAGTVRR